MLSSLSVGCSVLGIKVVRRCLRRMHLAVRPVDVDVFVTSCLALPQRRCAQRSVTFDGFGEMPRTDAAVSGNTTRRGAILTTAFRARRDEGATYSSGHGSRSTAAGMLKRGSKKRLEEDVVPIQGTCSLQTSDRAGAGIVFVDGSFHVKCLPYYCTYDSDLYPPLGELAILARTLEFILLSSSSPIKA